MTASFTALEQATLDWLFDQGIEDPAEITRNPKLAISYTAWLDNYDDWNEATESIPEDPEETTTETEEPTVVPPITTTTIPADQTANDSVSNSGGGIFSGALDILNQVAEAVNNISDRVVAAMSPVLKAAVPEFGEVALGLTGSISDTLDFIPETFEFLGEALLGIGTSIGAGLQEALLSIIEFIVRSLASVFPNMSNINFNPLEPVM
jgi:hypothetical protein